MVDDTLMQWPDGTVQGCDDDAYHWMSDDYVLVWARDEADALEQAHGR